MQHQPADLRILGVNLVQMNVVRKLNTTSYTCVYKYQHALHTHKYAHTDTATINTCISPLYHKMIMAYSNQHVICNRPDLLMYQTVLFYAVSMMWKLSDTQCMCVTCYR